MLLRIAFDDRRRNCVGYDYMRSIINALIIVVSIAAYLLNQFYLKTHYNNFILTSYWNDFWAALFILAYSNIWLSFYKNYNLTLDKLPKILFFILIVGSFWEYATPYFKKDSFSDPIDMLTYVTGAVFYYSITKSQFQNKEKIKIKLCERGY